MFLSAIIICLVSSAAGLLLSKSSVQICENRGLHGHGDPQNLVDGKSCEKKLIVVMTVKNNQVRVKYNVVRPLNHQIHPKNKFLLVIFEFGFARFLVYLLHESFLLFHASFYGV